MRNEPQPIPRSSLTFAHKLPLQDHVQRLHHRRQLGREGTAKGIDGMAGSGDGVLDHIRLGLVGFGWTAQVLGKFGETSRLQLAPELLHRARTELELPVLAAAKPNLYPAVMTACCP